MSRIWVAIVMVLGIGPNVLGAGEDAPAKDGEGGHKRLVVRLASVPAPKTADALQQLFRAEGQAVPSAAARSVVIVPEILIKVATTLSVADGQTVVLGAAARQPNSGTERLVLVTPRIQLVGSRAGPNP